MISDTEERIHPQGSKAIAIITFIGLILGIAGVSTAGDGDYKNGLTMGAMGIFLAVFVIILFMAIWLWFQVNHTLKVFQKKLFLAIALALPFVLIRLIYSALGDYTHIARFQLGGNETVYLCMNVLEEIFAMSIMMYLGTSAVLERDFIKFIPLGNSAGSKEDAVQA